MSAYAIQQPESCNIYSGCGRMVKGAVHNALAIGAAVYQWCEFKSRLGKNKNLSARGTEKDLENRCYVSHKKIHA